MDKLVESFSGVRGIFNKSLTVNHARLYARVYASWISERCESPSFVIGMDTRSSGRELKDCFISELQKYGNVIDVGIATTPVIEFAVRHFKANGGVIITASHNEPEYNGWKLLDENGGVLKADDMGSIIIGTKSDEFFEGKMHGKVVVKDATQLYLDFIFDLLGKQAVEDIRKKNFKIIADPNGGSAITLIKEALDKLNVETTYVNMKQGEFNRRIEPDKESLTELTKQVNDSDAMLGIAFDCDADRMEIVIPSNTGFAEKHGNILSGHYILALLVEEILSKDIKDQVIVVNNATSSLVKDAAQKYDAEVKESEVGEANVIEAMNKYSAVLGGEGSSSGGIIPPSRCRDGILGFIFILGLLSKRGSLDNILDELPDYYTLAGKIESDDIDIGKLKSGLRAHYSENGFSVNGTGSVKARKDDSFVWFRDSKTEHGIFRAIADSTSLEKAKKLLKEAEILVKKLSSEKA